MPEYSDRNDEKSSIDNERRNALIEIYCLLIEGEDNETPEPSYDLLTEEERKDMKLIQQGTLLHNYPKKITHIFKNPQWIEALKLLGDKSPKDVIKLLDLYAQNIISDNEMDTICLRIQKREIILEDPVLKPVIKNCSKTEWENITHRFIREYLEDHIQ